MKARNAVWIFVAAMSSTGMPSIPWFLLLAPLANHEWFFDLKGFVGFAETEDPYNNVSENMRISNFIPTSVLHNKRM